MALALVGLSMPAEVCGGSAAPVRIDQIKVVWPCSSRPSIREGRADGSLLAAGWIGTAWLTLPSVLGLGRGSESMLNRPHNNQE